MRGSQREANTLLEAAAREILGGDMKGVVVLAVLVGCASVADRSDFDDPPIRVTTDTAVHVIGPTFQLDFAATGIQLPEHLLVNHGLVDLLGTDDVCQGENRVGIVVSPPAQASAGTHGDGLHSEITTLLAGPAVAKIRVTFAVDYACPGAETLSGTTELTVFPNGRIVREDLAVRPSTNQLGLVGTCGCQQDLDPMNFHDLFFTTFWAFDPTGATQVQADGNPVTEDVYAACTMYAQRAVGVAFSQQAGTNTRFHSGLAASHSLDWPTAAHKMLDPDARAMTSAILISDTPPTAASDCGKVLAGLADVPLQIGDTRLGSTDHDGIYRDPLSHPTTFQIKPMGVAVPPGFAISVDLAGASHATLARSPATTRVGIAQREDASRFLIVFFDGLAVGESITVEPRS
jgi:hypothetical protein